MERTTRIELAWTSLATKCRTKRPRPRFVPPIGLEPTHCRLRVGCSTFELRRQCCGEASCHMTPRAGCHPLESNQNLSGFNRARRPTTQEWHREAWVRLTSLVFGCQSPVGTVSL